MQFYYPQKLLDLLTETIPLLNRSKKSVVYFFIQFGVPEELILDIVPDLINIKIDMSKRKIAGKILERLNEDQEAYDKERRQLLKGVIQFNSFSNCWESDRFKAKELIKKIIHLVDLSDLYRT